METRPQNCLTRAKEAYGIYLPISVVISGWMAAPRGKSPQIEPALCIIWASSRGLRLPTGRETQVFVVIFPWCMSESQTASVIALLFPKISTWSPLSGKKPTQNSKWWVRALDPKCEIQVPITVLKKGRKPYFCNIPQNICSEKTIYRTLVNRFPHHFSLSRACCIPAQFKQKASLVLTCFCQFADGLKCFIYTCTL